MASNSWKVLSSYPAFRWLLFTWLCKDVGDWLVRVANLLVIQQWAGTGSALSHLVLCSLLPKAVLAPIGGMLADRFDRRHLMIALDATAGVVVLGFLAAVHYKSVAILFVTTAMRSSISAIYYPVTHGLLPLMIPNNQDMQYGSTMLTAVYGLMSVVGGLVAGSAAVVLGLNACYAIDSVTYMLSSLAMLLFVSGNYRRQYHPEEHAEDNTVDTSKAPTAVSASTRSNWSCFRWCRRCCGKCGCLNDMCAALKRILAYLTSCGCAMLVFLKPTDSLIWGPGDIVAVEIATVRNADGSEDESASSYRMGLYYCFTGLGVFLGPTLANFVSDAERPASLQRSCCLAIFVAMIGWIIAAYSPTYNWYLMASWFSGLGYGTLWSYSSLLLQLLVDGGMLGRVLSIEYAIYVLAEAFSSSVTGPLYDLGYSTRDLCLFGALLAFTTLLFWTTFHLSGRGAAHPRFNRLSDPKKAAGLPSSIDVPEKDTDNDNKSSVSVC